VRYRKTGQHYTTHQTCSTNFVSEEKSITPYMTKRPPLRDHINVILLTANDIASINSPTSDDDLATTIFESLPPSWDQMVQLFNEKTARGKLCSDDVVSALLFKTDRKAAKAADSLLPLCS
jgi:gag-polypeptide of LTR copia-type